MFGIEGRYAHALFAVAAKQNSVEKVEKELADYQVNPIFDTHLSVLNALLVISIRNWCLRIRSLLNLLGTLHSTRGRKKVRKKMIEFP